MKGIVLNFKHLIFFFQTKHLVRNNKHEKEREGKLGSGKDGERKILSILRKHQHAHFVSPFRGHSHMLKLYQSTLGPLFRGSILKIIELLNGKQLYWKTLMQTKVYFQQNYLKYILLMRNLAKLVHLLCQDHSCTQHQSIKHPY